MKWILSIVFVLSLFITKSNAQYIGLEWVKQIGADTAECMVYDIVADAEGNTYTTGSYSAGVDFDPGPDEHIADLQPGFGAYLLKLNPAGELVWVRRLTGDSSQGNSITMDAAGNLLMACDFLGTVHLHTGGDSLSFTERVFRGGLIFKFDPDGNLIWAKQMSGRLHNFVVRTNENNEVWVAGNCTDTVIWEQDTFNLFPGLRVFFGNSFLLKLNTAGDLLWGRHFNSERLPALCAGLEGDVFWAGNVDVFNYTPHPTDSTFSAPALVHFQRIGPEGDVLWSKIFEGDGIAWCHSIAIDQTGDVILAGTFDGHFDLDPSPDNEVVHSTPLQHWRSWVVKISQEGDYEWGKTLDGGVNGIFRIITGKDNHIYATGLYVDTVDVDPGPGIFMLPFTDCCDDTFLTRWDANGNFVWGARIVESTYTKLSFALALDSLDNVFVAGHFDYDGFFGIGADAVYLHTGYLFPTTYIMKIGQDICADFSLVFDSFAHIGCNAPGYAGVHAQNGQAPYSYIWSTTPPSSDSTVYFTQRGIYELRLSDANGCSASTSILINGPEYPSQFDIKSSLIVSDVIRPGAPVHVWIHAMNDGCIPVAGSIELSFDSRISFVSAIPLPDVVTDNMLVWLFDGLTFDSAPLMPRATFDGPVASSWGDTVCFTLTALPIAGDANPADNWRQHCSRVVNSFDPNDISVYPPGDCDPGFVPAGQVLTYTVRFQNTGDAEAIHVNIIDTLDGHLNLHSLRVLGHSHPMMTEILPDNVLKFRFDHIYLPDSTSNEPESHGFVIFQIEPLSDIRDGAVISNKADIYFDSNPPIITNTVFNTIHSGSVDAGITQQGNTLRADWKNGSYQWIDCAYENNPIEGATGRSFEVLQSGSYAVVVSDGCYSDTSACVMVNIVGLAESSLHFLRVFPNPSSGQFFLDAGSLGSPDWIQISNFAGQAVPFQQSRHGRLSAIEVFAPAGLYRMTLGIGGEIRHVKLVVTGPH